MKLQQINPFYHFKGNLLQSRQGQKYGEKINIFKIFNLQNYFCLDYSCSLNNDQICLLSMLFVCIIQNFDFLCCSRCFALNPERGMLKRNLVGRDEIPNDTIYSSKWPMISLSCIKGRRLGRFILMISMLPSNTSTTFKLW